MSNPWRPSEFYPDPAIEILDESFRPYRINSAAVERIATGCRWAEGPVWFGDHGCLIWSDIPNDRMLRWDERSGAVSVFRQPTGYANGNTRDRQGRLITCEHLGRRVVRTEPDGSLSVLAERYEGKRLNSPNDVVVKSDGSIWFTDPPFGLLGDYEGRRADAELPTDVYRIDGASGRIDKVADGIDRPNGLCFSPDESILYIVECGTSPRSILAFDVGHKGARLENRRIFIDAGPGTPDGMRCDIAGNLWCGWGMGNPDLDGVMIFNPQGRPIGRVRLPERCANVCFGGADGQSAVHGRQPVGVRALRQYPGHSPAAERRTATASP
jgi:gluconolactonase